ncbi:hypothetical protein GH714_024117 [Hevea brasiliensis]|uniref:Cytochrome P450 n=1 Tax=Hevea brasiliensis TaxID=3981 RepID=A0A6A6MCI4_HEVBR|nr:hypothetical protein GH714_024117 [Hevea brasiliensis]
MKSLSAHGGPPSYPIIGCLMSFYKNRYRLLDCTKSLREFVVKTLQEEVENRLIPLLEKAADDEKVLDLQDVLRRFAFDIVGRVSLGTDPFCLDLSRPLPPLVKAFDTASEISAMRGTAPVYAVWKTKRMMNMGAEKKLKQAIKLVHSSVLEIVQSKKMVLENDQERKLDNDLLSRLLSAGHDEEVIRHANKFHYGWKRHNITAMTWLFWLLSKHQSSEEMIVDEVQTLLNNGERAIDYELLKDMNFLKACLCESMRLYPPVAWDSKHALADDVLPDGTFIGTGDRVTYFPYGMGRMDSLWGKDRFEFKPERG